MARNTTGSIAEEAGIPTLRQLRSRTPVGRTARTVLARPDAGVFIFLLLLSVGMVFASPNFASFVNWSSILSQAVFWAIPAVGMTFVLVVGGIDLSVGSVIGLSGTVGAYLIVHGTSMPLAFLAAVAVGAAVGTINGIVITKLHVPDFVVTLAMLGIVRGVLYTWLNANNIDSFTNQTYYKIAGLRRVWWQLTIPMLLTLVIVLVAHYALVRTRFGRHTTGAGSNVEAALVSGINVARLKIGVYTLSGTLAGVAGVLLAGQLGQIQPGLIGSGYEVYTIAAAILGGAALGGGRGSVIGALLGAITLGVIQNSINLLSINPFWEDITTGLLILLALLVARLAFLASKGLTGPLWPRIGRARSVGAAEFAPRSPTALGS